MKTLGYTKLLFFLLTLLFFVSSSQGNISQIEVSIQDDHARELLGKRIYKRLKIAKIDEDILTQYFVTIIEKSLRKKHAKYKKAIVTSVLESAEKYDFDPFFILAVISGESSFNPYIVGPVGEIGLMQIRPSTAKWITDKFGMKFSGKRSLRNPAISIKIGAAYLSYLRDKFKEESQLYLAAYNMGPTNVRKAVKKSVRPKDYALHIMKRYIDFYKNISTESVVKVAKI